MEPKHAIELLTNAHCLVFLDFALTGQEAD